jgi:hypothetical protein
VWGSGALVALALAAASLGCTVQEDTPDAGAALDPPTEERGTIGDTVELEGVDVDVLTLDSFDQSPQMFPRIRLTVRSENTTSRMVRNPDMELWCDEAEVGGEWYLGSTWEANGLLPGGGVSEGEIYLGFPPKPDADRYAVPTCTNARVKMISTNEGDRSQRVIVYPVDSEIIDEAIAAQVGRALPLPPRGA